MKIGFVYGYSEGQVLEKFGKQIASELATFGITLHTVDMRDSDSFLKNIIELAQQDPLFVFGYAGIGSKIDVSVNGVVANLWEQAKVPFISFYGDSPSYVEALHIQKSRWEVGLYGFPEHLEYRKTSSPVTGLLGKAPYWNLNLNTNLDYSHKKNGSLIFLKNIHNHEEIIVNWGKIQSLEIKNFLLEASDYLISNHSKKSHADVVLLVDNFVLTLNLFGSGLNNLRNYLVSQLDLFIRGYRTNFIAKILLDYPVQIHGSGWEHLDTTNSVGKIFSDVNYELSNSYITNALATLNISPNTSSGLHDRHARSFGAGTLCISNYSVNEVNDLMLPSAASYLLEESSIRESIEWALNNRGEVIELGKDLAEKMAANFSLDNGFNSLVEIATIIRAS
jgi:hypothetical protein